MKVAAITAGLAPADMAFGQFSPKELAKISGLPSALQRVWRKRGYLPAQSGTSIFTSLQVAEYAVRYSLGRYGLSPSETAAISSTAARTVLWYALLNHYGACEVRGELPDIEQFLSKFSADHQLAEALSGASAAQRFIVSTDGATPRLSDEDVKPADPGVHIAYLVVDLGAIAAKLTREAGKPLIIVNLGSAQSEYATYRLTGA